MDNLLKSVQVLCSVLVFLVDVNAVVTFCKGRPPNEAKIILSCNGTLHQPICLLCNISSSSKDTTWFVESTKLADEGFNFDASHAGGLVVNGCPGYDSYSLRLESPTTQNHNSLYYCRHKKRNVSAFVLNLHANSVLSINASTLSKDKLLLGDKESTLEAECILTAAVPPFMLAWSKNNAVKGKRMFNSSLQGQTTFTFIMTFSNLKNGDTLTCASEGMFIKRNYASFRVYIFNDEQDSDAISGESEDRVTEVVDAQQKPRSSQVTLRLTLAIIAGAVLFILIIVIILIFGWCCRSRISTSSINMESRKMKHVTSMSKEQESGHNDENSYIRMTDRERMEFSRNNLTIKESIGSGAFATVYRAEAFSIVKHGHTTTVAVKTLKENATENDRKDFMKELSLFKDLGEHENVVTMYGCCIDQGFLLNKTNTVASHKYSTKEGLAQLKSLFLPISDPVYLIMEYLPNGNLKQYLRSLISNNLYSRTFNNQVNQNQPASSELLGFGIQIAKGMEFLVSKQCVHRDLAARNILLGENNICKIADFGLARDVAERQEYEMKSRGRVPVRWLSPESLTQNIYTSKSDVWSFGIVMWEVITLGSHPYPGMSSRRVFEAIRNGFRLPQPDHCDDKIYAILMSCWKEHPAKRPSFHEIRISLERIMEDDQGYLQMDNFQQDKYLYLEPDVVLAEEM